MNVSDQFLDLIDEYNEGNPLSELFYEFANGDV